MEGANGDIIHAEGGSVGFHIIRAVGARGLAQQRGIVSPGWAYRVWVVRSTFWRR